MITPETISNAVRNEHPNVPAIVLGPEGAQREFPLKDLDYDSYIDFCRLAKPIITAVASGMAVKTDEKGEVDLGFNPFDLDFDTLIEMAGENLPRMAWLCLKQSEPKISIGEVKKLARRPQVMIEIVLAQVKHNEMVQEFASFFPRILQALTDLAPEAKAMLESQPTTE